MEEYMNQNQQDDIYNQPKRLEYWIKRIKTSSQILTINKQYLLDFLDECTVKEKLSVHRCLFYAQRLAKIAETVDKDFKLLEEPDFRKLAVAIDSMKRPDGNSISPETKNIYGVSMKKFYKWLFAGECPKLVKEWFKTNRKGEGLKPEDILTFDEVKRLIDVCENIRDKAILSVLVETGARATELGTLKIKSVIFDKYGVMISVRKSKTKIRAVRMLFGTEYLRQWLQCHPLKDNPESPLWVALEGKSKGSALQYCALTAVMLRAKQKTGITKRTNLHAWRHYKGTALADLGLNETTQSEIMGWKVGSDMVGVYNHLSGRQVDEAYLKAMGLQVENEKKEVAIRCHHCAVINSIGKEMCQNCNLPLNLTAAVSMNNTLVELDNIVKRIQGIEPVIAYFEKIAAKKQ